MSYTTLTLRIKMRVGSRDLMIQKRLYLAAKCTPDEEGSEDIVLLDKNEPHDMKLEFKVNWLMSAWKMPCVG